MIAGIITIATEVGGVGLHGPKVQLCTAEQRSRPTFSAPLSAHDTEIRPLFPRKLTDSCDCANMRRSTRLRYAAARAALLSVTGGATAALRTDAARHAAAIADEMIW